MVRWSFFRSYALPIGVVCCGVWGSGCHPATNGVDGTELDYRLIGPGDLGPSCAPVTGSADQQLSNGTFESGSGNANNGGQPVSSIAGPWVGCCNLDGLGQHTTWTVTTSMAHCGQQSIALSSSAQAKSNVLVQEHHIDGAGGKGFTLSGWFLIQSAGPDALLQLDLFDLGKNQGVAASPPLSSPTRGWVSLTATGSLPAGVSPQVQARVVDTGALSAFVDDVSLVLR